MNERVRCGWVGNDPLMVRYHDEEWGTPEHVAYELIEADNPGNLARYVLAMDLKQDVKVTPVQNMDEVIAMGKAIWLNLKELHLKDRPLQENHRSPSHNRPGLSIKKFQRKILSIRS